MDFERHARCFEMNGSRNEMAQPGLKVMFWVQKNKVVSKDTANDEFKSDFE